MDWLFVGFMCDMGPWDSMRLVLAISEPGTWGPMRARAYGGPPKQAPWLAADASQDAHIRVI